MAGLRINPLRIALLGALLVFALLQLPGASRALDIFDSRPPVRILFIGNSHTFAHDMPGMVRRLADSAGAPQRYDITMHAPGGREFRHHWANPAVQDLLQQPWDHVVLQGASAEPIAERYPRDFHTYGARLAELAAKTSGKRWLYVTWRYAPTNTWIRHNPQFDRDMHDLVQAAYRDLSAKTGAPRINVGKVWNDVNRTGPGFSLYEADGNHASIHGAYLAALMMFAHISGQSPETTTYRPAGITEADAAYLRSMAASGI